MSRSIGNRILYNICKNQSPRSIRKRDMRGSFFLTLKKCCFCPSSSIQIELRVCRLSGDPRCAFWWCRLFSRIALLPISSFSNSCNYKARSMRNSRYTWWILIILFNITFSYFLRHIVEGDLKKISWLFPHKYVSKRLTKCLLLTQYAIFH